MRSLNRKSKNSIACTIIGFGWNGKIQKADRPLAGFAGETSRRGGQKE